jgi:hypothetical protein
LNVPEKRNQRLSLYKKKLKWIMYGIFAPELVVYTAWRQWTSARALTRIVNKCFKEQVRLSVAIYLAADRDRV